MTEHRTISSADEDQTTGDSQNIRRSSAGITLWEMTYLDDLMEHEEIRSLTDMVEAEISRFVSETKGEPKILYDAALHLLRAGGKRLRSLVTLLACQAVGGDVKHALPYSVAAELVQTASLMHDDVIDDDKLRRGVETAHEKFGSKLAVLAGDLLLAQAIQIVGDKTNPELIVQLARTGIRMCEGEAADYLMCKNGPESFTKKDYLNMISLKTVSFIREAARTGAIIGNANESQMKAILTYAEMLGYAFQIRDDTLNLTTTKEVAGKSVLSDLDLRRCNYPLTHALETLPEQSRKSLLEALSNGATRDALAIIQDCGALEHSIRITETYVENAKAALEGQCFVNEGLLLMLADFIIKRAH
ncbi:MAG: polyprenyl synthetase family protein [Candidatus Thorarchaeota archaeon]